MRTAYGRPAVREMIREAVAALGSPTTRQAVCEYVLSRYPGTNVGTVQCELTLCTVNQPSRLHYSQNQKPRVANDPRYDLLFSPSRGMVEWYRPVVHGVWSIVVDTEGRLAICREGGEPIYQEQMASVWAEVGSGR